MMIMDTINPIRLWRVEVRSRYGYQAPYQLVEAKKKEVHQSVKNLHLRLLDFPNIWYYQLVDLRKVFDTKRGKWVDEKKKPQRPRIINTEPPVVKEEVIRFTNKVN